METHHLHTKRQFSVYEDGATYAVPTYTAEEKLEMVASEGLVIDIVRGRGPAAAPHMPNDGTLHEHLLSVCLHDLENKARIVADIMTMRAIESIKRALWCMEERSRRREQAGLQGTYEPTPEPLPLLLEEDDATTVVNQYGKEGRILATMTSTISGDTWYVVYYREIDKSIGSMVIDKFGHTSTGLVWTRKEEEE